MENITKFWNAIASSEGEYKTESGTLKFNCIKSITFYQQQASNHNQKMHNGRETHKLQSFFQAFLVGPIGPRSHALLHPSVVRNNSTRIAQDELHVILEYKQGEIIGEYVAPASSRFIASHDQFSGSALVIDLFFKNIAQVRPDLIVLTGVHLLQFQTKEMRLEKLRLLKRSMLQISPLMPIHFELGSMSDPTFVNEVLYRVSFFFNCIKAICGLTSKFQNIFVFFVLSNLGGILRKFGELIKTGLGNTCFVFFFYSIFYIRLRSKQWHSKI